MSRTMQICFLLFLIIVGSTYTQVIPYKVGYFDQLLDHFNFASFGGKTYRQRYLLQDKWWNKDGPIFFYTGNEGDITEFWTATGFMFDIAPQFNALVLFAEHRFYGKSLPCGPDDSFKQPCLGLLTVEQALADFATLLTWYKEKNGVQNVPVIAFGGSYGGMLSAWMRFKYPNIIDGALAASAPLFLVAGLTPRNQFFQDVTADYDQTPSCVADIRQGFKIMEDLANKGKQGLQLLSSAFSVCQPLQSTADYTHLLGWIRNSFTNMAMFDYPYKSSGLADLPGYPVKAACQIVLNSKDKLAGLAKAAGLFYNGTTGHLKCFDIQTEFVECADPTGCGTGPTSLAWDYQACTEMILPAGTDGVADMFPVLPFTLEMRTEYCQQRWNVTPRDDWLKIHYWGLDIKSASNILFSNGNLDPWHRGGVSKSLSDSLIAIPIENGAHHLDLRAKNPADPDSVKKARQTEIKYITKWIKNARLKHSKTEL